jgi:hypothetical protein
MRDFVAKIRTGTCGFNLHCRKCNTWEELPEGKFPHDAALGHARWFHRGPIAVPTGWQHAHRQPPDTSKYNL